MQFKTYLEQQEFVDFILNEFDNNPAHVSTPSWRAKKSEIMQTWANLKPDAPIYMTPVKSSVEGTKSFGEDGIRISGSWPFIASVLGRLKELMEYENPQTRLKLVFRGVDKGSPDHQSFIFYANAENRGKKKGNVT
jgi:hypothetical protein